MDVCLLRMLCVVRWRSLRRADHSPVGVLPCGVSVDDLDTSTMRRPGPTRVDEP
jgi:hypothetical protein